MCVCVCVCARVCVCYILQLYCPNVFSPPEIRVAFLCESQLRHGRATQPTVHAGRFHNLPNSDMDYRIFNVPTDVNVYDCTRGCMDTVRESELNVDSGRKIPCRIGKSNLRQRRDGPML